jgi:hypothetical protein
MKMLATSDIPSFEGDEGGECSLDSTEDGVDIMVVGIRELMNKLERETVTESRPIERKISDFSRRFPF